MYVINKLEFYFGSWFSKGKRPLGRPRGRWENNIKMNLPEVG
jgi:hypothetical protein